MTDQLKPAAPEGLLPPKFTDGLLAKIEAFLIEETGNGPFAAYVVEYLERRPPSAEQPTAAAVDEAERDMIECLSPELTRAQLASCESVIRHVFANLRASYTAQPDRRTDSAASGKKTLHDP